MECGGDEFQNQVVLLVGGDEARKVQQILIPNGESYISVALFTLPTAEGGCHKMIIPISCSGNGNSSITVPKGYTLGADDEDGNVALALDPDHGDEVFALDTLEHRVLVEESPDGQQRDGGHTYTYTRVVIPMIKIRTADGDHTKFISPFPRLHGHSYSIISLPLTYTMGPDGNVTLALDPDPNYMALGEDGQPHPLVLSVDERLNQESFLQDSLNNGLLASVLGDAVEVFVAQVAGNHEEQDQGGENVHVELDDSQNQMMFGEDGGASRQIRQVHFLVGAEDQLCVRAAVYRFPKVGGGYQNFCIRISPGENGNSTITLPPRYTLGPYGNITLVQDPSQLPLGEEGQLQQMVLPVYPDGRINLERFMQANEEAMQQEIDSIWKPD